MRYFLVDKVTELVPGVRIRGIKNITLSDEVLHDHFPDHPVMPGALIVEAASQLAGFLLECTFNGNREAQGDLRALLMQIDQAKFYEASGPGDQLDIQVQIEARLEVAAKVKANVFVGDKRIARANLTFVVKRIDSERVHEQRRYLYRLWTRGLAS